VGDLLKPGAELLLMDPHGRRVGRDPQTGQTFAEMSNSSYEYEGIGDAVTGAMGPETGIIYVGDPSDGEYFLKVIGLKRCHYDLTIRGYDEDMDPSDAIFTNIVIDENVEHTYLIIYSMKKGNKIRAIRTR
jgi:hypothetical protein